LLGFNQPTGIILDQSREGEAEKEVWESKEGAEGDREMGS